MTDDLMARARAWAAADPDPETAGQVVALSEAGDTAGLRALFGGRLTWRGHDFALMSDGTLVPDGDRSPR